LESNRLNKQLRWKRSPWGLPHSQNNKKKTPRSIKQPEGRPGRSLPSASLWSPPGVPPSVSHAARRMPKIQRNPEKHYRSNKSGEYVPQEEWYEISLLSLSRNSYTRKKSHLSPDQRSACPSPLPVLVPVPFQGERRQQARTPPSAPSARDAAPSQSQQL